MKLSSRTFAGVLFSVFAALAAGCGGGSASNPPPGNICKLNSDCTQPLVCNFGACHEACATNADCPTTSPPTLCLKTGTVAGSDAGTVNVCQLQIEAKCAYNSECKNPLVCGRDDTCRNQCVTNQDCVSPQVCTDSKVCALPEELQPGTNDVKMADAGVPGTGGTAGAAGGGTGGAGGMAGSAAGAPGTGGTAGAGGKAGASGTGGAGGVGGSSGCGTGCGVGKQCVSNACVPCGTSGAVCCGTGTSATCNSNLTCDSTSTCTCGDSGQACCNGTTCNTGFQCLNGTCTCGGAGQYCCSGTPKCSGSLLCGGRRCGCATACDENAALKSDGSIFVSGTPVTNTNGTLFLATAVTTNGTVSCAIKADGTGLTGPGTVWCWGSNTYGALGIGDTTISSSTHPVQVSTAMASGSPLMGITALSAADSGYNVCALGPNGGVWCWGYGGYGQLGIGDESNSSFAVPVVADSGQTPVTGFKTISASYYNTCGMKTDNSVWCWGDNYYGQIGKGTDGLDTPAQRYITYPTQVTDLNTSATSVIASYWNYNVCASTNDGSAYCWGNNGSGNLANGLNTGLSNVPSQVLTAAGTPLTNVKQVLNWYGRPCALRNDGSIWCFPDPYTSGNYYAAQLKDSASNRVTGLTTVGRDCYLDTDDQVWINGSTSSSYQVTCP